MAWLPSQALQIAIRSPPPPLVLMAGLTQWQRLLLLLLIPLLPGERELLPLAQVALGLERGLGHLVHSQDPPCRRRRSSRAQAALQQR
jgi:hypothetical protein